MTRSATQKFNPKLDLLLERVVDVPRARVWECWTTPRHVLKWFTPAPWKTIECKFDLRPGGRFFTMMQSPEGKNFPNEGCFLEVVKHEKLVWTAALGPGYRPQAKSVIDMPFTAVITLKRVGKGTKYSALVIHGDEGSAKKHAEMGFYDGWGKALEQLVAVAKRL